MEIEDTTADPVCLHDTAGLHNDTSCALFVPRLRNARIWPSVCAPPDAEKVGLYNAMLPAPNMSFPKAGLL